MQPDADPLRDELARLLLPLTHNMRVKWLMFGGLGQCCIAFENGYEVLVPGSRQWTREEIALARDLVAVSNATPPGPPPLGRRPAFLDERL
jgi:hypothetical protein